MTAQLRRPAGMRDWHNLSSRSSQRLPAAAHNAVQRPHPCYAFNVHGPCWHGACRMVGILQTRCRRATLSTRCQLTPAATGLGPSSWPAQTCGGRPNYRAACVVISAFTVHLESILECLGSIRAQAAAVGMQCHRALLPWLHYCCGTCLSSCKRHKHEPCLFGRRRVQGDASWGKVGLSAWQAAAHGMSS